MAVGASEAPLDNAHSWIQDNQEKHAHIVMLHMPGGEKYSGSLIMGKKHGLGKCWYNNGDEYQGEWHKGAIHGYGLYYYKATGETYHGEW